MAGWSFLTNHARVLLAIAGQPDIRLRDIAEQVGITERRAHGIVDDLTNSGYLTKERVGRRTHYGIQRHQPLEEDLTPLRTIGDMLALLIEADRATTEGHEPRD